MSSVNSQQQAGAGRYLFGRSARLLIVLPPLLFLVTFFLIPFLYAFKISFAHTALQIPPYTDVLVLRHGHWPRLTLSLDNYRFLFTDSMYVESYLYSLRTAFLATVLCLLLGFPMAYAIARAPKRTQNLLLLVIILPFWTSFLLRVYSLEGLIRDNGVLNSALLWLGWIHHPLHIMRTTTAVYLGIVYTYLPFMILPLYATLEKLDNSLLEAAADLGSPPWRTFIDVTLRLSMPGIIAGSMLVFIPAVGEFVIPSLLGGPDNLMIGRVLWDEFFSNRDWPVASAVAVMFLLFLAGPMALYQHYSRTEAEAA